MQALASSDGDADSSEKILMVALSRLSSAYESEEKDLARWKSAWFLILCHL